jgi:hypothetical protein
MTVEANDVIGNFFLPAPNCPFSPGWLVPSPYLLQFRMELVSRKLSSGFRMTVLLAAVFSVSYKIHIVTAAVSWRLPATVINQARGKPVRGLGENHNDQCDMTVIVVI